jgi:hypothetical protein
MITPPIRSDGFGRNGVASSGAATIATMIAECESNETGTVYHFRLPSEIDGRVTSPNRSRGMGISLCLCRDARPGQRLVED